VETLGSEIDTAAVTLTPAGGSALTPTGATLLSQSPLGGFGGFQDDYQFTWNVPGNAASYTLAFTSNDTSMSWAGARVDTAASAVPEPASVGMLTVAAIGIFRRRRSIAQHG
jgi:hypothetical protein